jgi:hypothetical protein
MYFVFEIQKQENGSCACLVYHEDSWDYFQAESVYFGKLQYAAISTIPIHTVMLCDAEGSVYGTKTYDRQAKAEE